MADSHSFSATYRIGCSSMNARCQASPECGARGALASSNEGRQARLSCAVPS
jgi:hypothetical protein